MISCAYSLRFFSLVVCDVGMMTGKGKKVLKQNFFINPHGTKKITLYFKTLCHCMSYNIFPHLHDLPKHLTCLVPDAGGIDVN